MCIFSKTTNDVGVLKQRLVSTSNTSVTALLSPKKLKTFRNELFKAILAEHISLNEHAGQISLLSAKPTLSQHWRMQTMLTR